MTDTTTKARPRKTAAQKAVEGLAAANARYARAEEKRNRLKAELEVAQRELEAADKVTRYAAQHPDLPSDG